LEGKDVEDCDQSCEFVRVCGGIEVFFYETPNLECVDGEYN
jgi:hypothetical protein